MHYLVYTACYAIISFYQHIALPNIATINAVTNFKMLITIHTKNVHFKLWQKYKASDWQ